MELGADVVAEEARASYDDGMLVVEVPLARARGDPAAGADRGLGEPVTVIEIPASAGEPQELEVGTTPARGAADPAAEGQRAVPGDARPAGGRPGALGQALVNDVLGGHRMLAMAASRDAEIENPGPEQIYGVGVAGPDRADDQGARRDAADPGPRRPAGCDSATHVQSEPYLVAKVSELPDEVSPSPELEALFRNVQSTFSEIIEEVPYLPEELQMAVANLEDPAELAHMIAGALRIKTEERQELLEELDVAKRLRRLSELLAREIELISIGSQIQSQVESEIDKGQREFFLRQQLKAIQEELGEVDEAQAETAELREQVEAAELPEHALKQVERELQRFERLPPQSAEHGVIRSYIEWIVSLPWSKATDDHLDLEERAQDARP